MTGSSSFFECRGLVCGALRQLPASRRDAIRGAGYALHDLLQLFGRNSLRLDCTAQTAGNPASGNNFKDHEKSMHQNDSETCLVVEDASRHQEPEHHMVKSNHKRRRKKGPDTAEDDANCQRSEDMKMHFNHAAPEMNEQRAHAHG